MQSEQAVRARVDMWLQIAAKDTESLNKIWATDVYTNFLECVHRARECEAILEDRKLHWDVQHEVSALIKRIGLIKDKFKREEAERKAERERLQVKRQKRAAKKALEQSTLNAE